MSPASYPIHVRPSPHYNERPAGTVVSAIILHADASPRVSSSIAWMKNAESRVSYHYLIGRAGHIYQLVEPQYRAWHAGTSELHGRWRCNDYSLGVCFGNLNDGKEPYPDAQLAAGAWLVADLMRRYPSIGFDDIATHAAVARPRGRKTDPGPRFPLTDFLARVRMALGCSTAL